MQKGVQKFSGPGGFTSDPTVNDMGHTTKGNCQKKGKEYFFSLIICFLVIALDNPPIEPVEAIAKCFCREMSNYSSV